MHVFGGGHQGEYGGDAEGVARRAERLAPQREADGDEAIDGDGDDEPDGGVGAREEREHYKPAGDRTRRGSRGLCWREARVCGECRLGTHRASQDVSLTLKDVLLRLICCICFVNYTFTQKKTSERLPAKERDRKDQMKN